MVSTSPKAMIAKESTKKKKNFAKKRVNKLKRVKEIIKHKGCQKSTQITKML